MTIRTPVQEEITPVILVDAQGNYVASANIASVSFTQVDETHTLNSNHAVNVADSVVLAANPNALERTIVNDSPNVIYLWLGTGPAVAGQGIRLNPSGGTWSSQRYKGVVHGVATANGSNVTLSEVGT